MKKNVLFVATLLAASTVFAESRSLTASAQALKDLLNGSGQVSAAVLTTSEKGINSVAAEVSRIGTQISNDVSEAVEGSGQASLAAGKFVVGTIVSVANNTVKIVSAAGNFSLTVSKEAAEKADQILRKTGKVVVAFVGATSETISEVTQSVVNESRLVMVAISTDVGASIQASGDVSGQLSQASGQIIINIGRGLEEMGSMLRK